MPRDGDLNHGRFEVMVRECGKVGLAKDEKKVTDGEEEDDEEEEEENEDIEGNISYITGDITVSRVGSIRYSIGRYRRYSLYVSFK